MTDVVLDWIELYVSTPKSNKNGNDLVELIGRILDEQFFVNNRKWFELDKLRLEEIVLKIQPNNVSEDRITKRI